MITKAQIYVNTANYFMRSRLHRTDIELPLIGGGKVGSVNEQEIDDVLTQYDDDVVFVHAGLSNIKSAFDTNPYEFLLDKLDKHFKSILAPGFTPSFGSSGIYHKQYSKPEYGAFSRLFLQDSNYRTDDAIHSILVRGDYRFEEYNHNKSFGENSCWCKLEENNVLYLNIGTPWIISTQLHHIEHKMDVPYLQQTEHPGVIYHDSTSHNETIQYNHKYEYPIKWNRHKIARALRQHGRLSINDFRGLNVFFFRAGDLHQILTNKIRSDPYYLVT